MLIIRFSPRGNSQDLSDPEYHEMLIFAPLCIPCHDFLPQGSPQDCVTDYNLQSCVLQQTLLLCSVATIGILSQ